MAQFTWLFDSTKIDQNKTGTKMDVFIPPNYSILSMDWFEGTITGKPPDLIGKYMVSCRFSLKQIHKF